ncbi:SRPBCC family protein [Tumidithrix elongata]
MKSEMPRNLNLDRTPNQSLDRNLVIPTKSPIEFQGHPSRVNGLTRTFKQVSLTCVTVLAIVCGATSALPAQAQFFDGPVDVLPPIQRDALRKGMVVVTGDRGQYVARILVNASVPTAWNVLTDYGNLANFIPNMASSRVLENNGDRKVVEQVDQRQIFLTTITSRTKLAITESNQQQIDFSLISGDLAGMTGSWQLEPVSVVPRQPPTQVLITYTVNVQPNDSTPSDVFYQIFKASLRETLDAIGQEISRR